MAFVERRANVWKWAALLLGAAAACLAAFVVWGGLLSPLGSLAGQTNETRVSHSVVVERVQKVAKLATSEAVLRDVVIYENTWYGSKKRSLVVVTGRVLAGIDLDAGTDVKIDDGARRVTISLPRAGLLAVDLTELKTYDEQGGLWNPFRPEDRDAIFQTAREQIDQTSRELKLAETAQANAKELLEGMFAVDGYTVEVVFQ